MFTAEMLQHRRSLLGARPRNVADISGDEFPRMPDAVMVVAHPDDEILWFSSVLRQCKRVVVCFGASATSTETWDDGRAVMMDTYPLRKVQFLRVRQSDAFEASNWNKPMEDDSGLRLSRRPSPSYEKNAAELRRILAVELSGESLVFTHNPWGEYGNEEHVQVFRVLTALKDELGFDLYVDSYVSDRSAKLMCKSARSLEGNPLVCQTNRTLAHTLRNQYLKNNCWTWMTDYEWPAYESFYHVATAVDGAESGIPAGYPLNYLTYSFKRGPIRTIAGKALPPSVKSRIKRVCHVR